MRILLLLALWSVSGAAFADETIRIVGGTEDRTDVLVRVALEASNPLIGKPVEVTDGSGTKYLAQTSAKGGLMTPGAELVVLLPTLEAGSKVELKARIAAAAPSAAFSYSEKEGMLPEIDFAGKPAMKFFNTPLDETSKEARSKTFKVYHHLFDDTGTVQLTNGAEGRFPHHRGLFFGFNKVTYKVDGKDRQADVWHCNKGESQSHDKTLLTETGPLFARHRVEIGWHGQDKAVFATEVRELTVWRLPKGRSIDFASQVSTKLDAVRLDGDPQHAGFHFRASQEVEAKHTKETYFLRATGKGEKGTEVNWPANKAAIDYPWNAMSFVVGDARYTAVYIPHPDNPKQERYSERTYGRFGCYFEYTATPEKPLNVRYRLWMQKGETTAAACDMLKAQFAKPTMGQSVK